MQFVVAAFSNGDYVPASLRTVVVIGGSSIGESAFKGCTNLTNITIPDSVTSIGDDVFYGCSGLTDVYYIDTKNDWAAITKRSGNINLTNSTIHYNWTDE